ncbi:hypothetical protein T492DRAFT_907731 [Pavlovales sp. CCMP2436]|nr:hypothetical protein T492DRAFT_907731 [Pavlovales sp. CCMP2436]
MGSFLASQPKLWLDLVAGVQLFFNPLARAVTKFGDQAVEVGNKAVEVGNRAVNMATIVTLFSVILFAAIKSHLFQSTAKRTLGNDPPHDAMLLQLQPRQPAPDHQPSNNGTRHRNTSEAGAQPLAAEAGAGRRGVGPARGGVGSRRLVVGRIGIKRIGAGGGGARCASLSRCAGMGWRRRRGRAFGWLRWMHTEPRPSLGTVISV